MFTGDLRDLIEMGDGGAIYQRSNDHAMILLVICIFSSIKKDIFLRIDSRFFHGEAVNKFTAGLVEKARVGGINPAVVLHFVHRQIRAMKDGLIPKDLKRPDGV